MEMKDPIMAEPPEGPATTDFKITAPARLWKGFFGAATMIVDEIKLNVTKNGIGFAAVDPAHVCMATLEIDKEEFLEFKAEPGIIGINTEKVAEWLNKFKDDEPLTFWRSERTGVTGSTKHNLHIDSANIEKTISCVDTTGISEPKIPNLNLECFLSLPRADLKRYIGMMKGSMGYVKFVHESTPDPTYKASGKEQVPLPLLGRP